MTGDEAVGGEAAGDGVDPRRRTGRLGEDHAAGLMQARGGVVISRNWRCRAGELDLVVLDAAGRLRFVEVRARTGTGFGTPAESVTPDKQRRLRRLAAHWLSENPGRWRQVCFDVVGVDLADPTRPRLELFEDVL
ncbi:putative endonuclease [Dietzia kunjamensis]|jgi:putative endonuclease|uniref:YraN family protein n=1 Tax=Dietzia kunjamensis TaxID=322509 RepID=UPI000E714C61|nr:YraN family protein [Dietzia kunjamensis]RKE66597.1 putative endonuclease [Dietzia kunjamensis]HBD22746.1 YraN family protein [Dietzia sp.]